MSVSRSETSWGRHGPAWGRLEDIQGTSLGRLRCCRGVYGALRVLFLFAVLFYVFLGILKHFCAVLGRLAASWKRLEAVLGRPGVVLGRLANVLGHLGAS